MSPTVSWVILTYNRAEMVDRALTHCMDNAGDKWDELIWVDNGSSFKDWSYLNAVLDPDISIRNKTNLGVAKGYNRGLGLATKDYIVLTGCDMLLPDNWLATFKRYVTEIPQTGVACIYSKPLSECPDRMRKSYAGVWSYDSFNGLPIAHAMPIERRIFRRSLLSEIGYFPEDFGLYGYDDVAWSFRAEKVCDQMGLLYYVIPDMQSIHLGTEGASEYDGKEDAEYHRMKRKEADDQRKMLTLARRKAQGWPKFTPFL